MPSALVTGPTSGIGRAFADALARRGYDLVLVSRDAARLQQVADEIRHATGAGIEVLPADLADRAQVAAVEARLQDEARPVDVLVNNAGFGIRSAFATSDVDDEQRMLDVMVTAVMRLAHAAVPGMVRRRHGVVINVSSVASWIAGGTYSAAKSWVTVFSEGLNGELSGTGVRVTAVCPGFVRTEFHERAGMNMAGVPSWMWLDADRVVRDAMRDAAGNRAVSVPSSRYLALTLVLRHSPRFLARRVGGRRSASRARE